MSIGPFSAVSGQVLNRAAVGPRPCIRMGGGGWALLAVMGSAADAPSASIMRDVVLPLLRHPVLLIGVGVLVGSLSVVSVVNWIRRRRDQRALGERLKELSCLYNISRELERADGTRDILDRVTPLITSGWQYPDDARARVVFDQLETCSQAFKETEWRLTSPLFVNGEERGCVEVHYLSAHPMLDNGPFLMEERELLEAIARMLGHALGRVHTHDALHENQRRLTTLMDNLPGMAYRCRNDRHWTMEFISRGCEELTGYPQEDLIDNRRLAYNDLILPKYREEVWNGVQEGVRDGKPFQLTYRIKSADGTEKWVWEQGVGVFSPAGELVALEGFITDITASKQSELNLVATKQELEQSVTEQSRELADKTQKLRHEVEIRAHAEESAEESEKRFRSLCVAAPIGIFLTDAEGSTVYVNEFLEQLCGLPAEACKGFGWFTIIHEDDRERIVAQAQKAARDGEALAASFKIRSGDGHIRLIQVRTALIHGEDGRLRGKVGTVEDITARREAEEALEKTSEQLSTLLQNTRDFVYRHDADGRFTYLSPSVEQITGYRPDEYKQHYKDTLTDNAINDQVVEYTERALKTGKEMPPYLVEIRHRDGHPITLEVNERPYFEDNLVAGIIGVSRDVTERVRAEAELRRAKAAAEEANRVKNVFLANMSHELRTPLNAIINASDMLVHRDGRDGLSDSRDIIKRNGRQLLTLLNDLLDSARIEAGTLGIRPCECSLLEIITDVQATVVPLHVNPSVELHIMWSTPVPDLIRTDPTRVRQALINLVSNALKFTERGHVNILVGVKREDDANHQLTVCVEDTGRGMAPDEKDKIFQPFYQSSHTEENPHRGVGLGLTLTRWIAEQLGGALEVESAPGKGSTFSLSIPVQAVPGSDWITPSGATRRAQRVAERANAPVQLHGRVLLAEDYRDTRTMLQRGLRDAGAEVTAVTNGREAIEAVRTAEFDLIVLDLRMPEIDGGQAARVIREQGSRVPMIAMTASTETHEQRSIVEAGFDDLWVKPLPLDEFIHRCGEYMASGPSPSTQHLDRADVEMNDRQATQALQNLTREFLDALPDRVEAVAAHLRARDFRQAYEEMHKIIGAAGMYDLMDISAHGRTLEAMIESESLTAESDEFQAFRRHVNESIAAHPAR